MDQLVTALFATEEYQSKSREFLQTVFHYIRSFFGDDFSFREEKIILAQGELISTQVFYYYLCEQGIRADLLNALNFMRIDRSEEPDLYYIRENINRELQKHEPDTLFITQGFICRNVYGDIDNLKRGGSDYTASIIGAALNSEEIEIWTDIDGFHNNDPRYVEDTYCLPELSFDEAAELAYFGAKILHPASILPAKIANIPVRLKNTMEPSAPGTLITNNQLTSPEIKAVAAKDGITSIKIRSSRMLLAYGFMRKVFETFERYRTPVDMITTSEIAVSVTIDNDTYLEKIVDELKLYGFVEVDDKLSIICIAGNLGNNKTGLAAQVFSALSGIPLRMISYGASENSISILVSTSDKVNALKALNQNLFLKNKE
jgi:aspartate kinase